MTIGDQGDIDLDLFDPSDPNTFPFPLDPHSGFRAGQYWKVLYPGGTVGGVALVENDRVYVVSTGRSYGAGTYGSAVYGWLQYGPWTDDEVDFVGFPATHPAWDRPAAPYTGCELGDRFPGWRIVIEGLFVDAALHPTRTYGTANYGDLLYGDTVADHAHMDWVDMTTTGFGLSIRRGADVGTPYIPVDEARFDFVDVAADLFATNQPESWAAPRVGTMIRAGVMSPSLAYTALFAGRIERISDTHDTPPRLVSVDAFGLAFDLVSSIADWHRGHEDADVRLDALIAASGYAWAPHDPYPAPVPGLEADPSPSGGHGHDGRIVVVRSEFDRTAISAGWQFDTTAAGHIRLRPWPLTASAHVKVSDCAAPGVLVSPSVELTDDMAELVNAAEYANTANDTHTSVDAGSIDFFGRRSQALGMPFDGLAAGRTELAALADTALARYRRIVNRIASFEADTTVDADWLAFLVGLDSGQGIHFDRVGIPDHLVRLDAVVVGFEHRLVPNRWTATVFCSTETESI